MSSTSECPVENVWIKVTKGCNKYIIGAVYHHPGCKIILQKNWIIYLICFIAGDVNTDLKNFRVIKKPRLILTT